MNHTELTLKMIRDEWEAPLKAKIQELEEALRKTRDQKRRVRDILNES